MSRPKILMEHPKDVEIFGFQTFYKLQVIHYQRNTPVYEVINGSKNGYQRVKPNVVVLLVKGVPVLLWACGSFETFNQAVGSD